MIGQRLLHYEILEKLGEGGMGVVYKARDTHLDRFVAIKVLPPEKVADAGRKARFVQEAKSASALNHPNIVHIYDISSDGGVDFIAMEYVAGKTLDQFIPRKGLRLDESLKLAVQIAGAVARAHAAGIIHRDLKPSNIMVDEHGAVKVLDFGLAKLTEAAPSEDDSTRTVKPATEEGTIIGTAAYMSPEQAEGKKLDARSDIFSFGAVLYEMVTGQRAFRGDSKMSTLAAVIHEEPPPPDETVPQEMRRVIAHCLRKDPARRFQHMDDVRSLLEELKEESDSGRLAGAPPRGVVRARRLPLALAALAVVAVIIAALWYARSGTKTPPAPLRAFPLTTYAGFELNPSFSPDGNQVAFSWNGERQDNYDIYIKLIGPGAPLRLTTDPAEDRSPAWSPDGKWIAFVRLQDRGNGAIFLIPSLGGPERQLAPIGVPADSFSSFLTWTKDGKWLVVADARRGDQPAGLFLHSPETGERRRLTRGSAVSPSLSPDGRHLAFIRTSEVTVTDVYLLDLSTDLEPQGEPRRLTFLNQAVDSPVWTPDGREIVFSSGGHGGQRSLWRVSASAGSRPDSSPKPEPVGEEAASLAVSSTARRLIYMRLFTDSDIYRIELRGPGVAAGPAVKLISSTRLEQNAQYSPDGKRIAFTSHRSGAQEIWVSNADGSNPAQLTSAGGPMVANPRWSPDGRRLVFHSLLGGVRDILLIGANGGAIQRLGDGGKGGSQPTWSRDGKWIYFGSGRGGRGEVWKMPSGGGEPVQVTRNGGGGAAFESLDGKFLYYAKGRRVWKVPLAGGDETQVVKEPLNYASDFVVVEEGIYFLSGPGPPAPGVLYLLEFATGALKQIATTKGLSYGLTISPDRRSILYSQFDQPGSDLMLVENFR